MRADGSVVVGQVNIYTITVGFDCVVSIHIGKDVFKVRSFTKVVRGSRISRFLMMMILVTTVQIPEDPVVSSLELVLLLTRLVLLWDLLP